VLAWFRKVDLDEAFEVRNALMVQLICAGLLTYLAFSEVIRFLTRSPSLSATYLVPSLFNAAVGAGLAIAWWRVRRGRMDQALVFLVAPSVGFGWLVICLFGLSFSLDTMRAFPVIFALTALLSGRRALWLSLAAVVLGMAMGHLRDLGMLGPAPVVPPYVPTLRPAGQTVLGFLALAVVLDRFGVALRDALVTAIAGRKKLADEMEQRVRAQVALAASQRLETVGRLSAGVAHDFNNLVMIIGSAAAIAQKHAGKPEVVASSLTTITDATRRVEHLTRQLLTFAKRQVVVPTVVCADELLARLVPLLQRVAGEAVTLVPRLEAHEAQLRIDPVQLEQLVLNLVSNSRDAMSKGGTIQLLTDVASGSEAGREGEHVRVRVVDDGVGMDDATRARIFEPFFTTKPNGTGIGMAACLEIVTQANGRLSVESAPGKGTTVTAVFPIVRDSARGSATNAARLAASGKGETVLVVEDQAPLRGALAQGLTERGYRVIEAANGTDALAAASAEQSTLRVVVTDLHMDGLPGAEVIERVRAWQPGVKFLLMSGDAEALARAAVWAPEGTRVLAKPISTDRIGDQVAELLAGR
jgi:signal transduction histidine kinase